MKTPGLESDLTQFFGWQTLFLTVPQSSTEANLMLFHISHAQDPISSDRRHIWCALESSMLTPPDPASYYWCYWHISCPRCFSLQAETLMCLSRVAEQVLLEVQSLKWDCPHSSGFQIDTCSLGHVPAVSFWISGHQQPPSLCGSQIGGGHLLYWPLSSSQHHFALIILLSVHRT